MNPTALITVSERPHPNNPDVTIFRASWRKMRDGRRTGHARGVYEVDSCHGGRAAIGQRVAGMRMDLERKGHVVQVQG